MLFQQLTYADHVDDGATTIDNFRKRMERFLNCISQVYFQQESFNPNIWWNVSGNDKAADKKLIQSVEYGSQQQQQQQPIKDIPGIDNWDYCQHF